MSVEWVLYWIDILGNVSWLFFALFSVSCFFAYANHIPECDFKLKAQEQLISDIKTPDVISTIMAFISLLGLILSVTFIPSQKTMYAMAFTKYSKQLEIPEKVLKAIETKLYDIIERG